MMWQLQEINHVAFNPVLILFALLFTSNGDDDVVNLFRQGHFLMVAC